MACQSTTECTCTYTNCSRHGNCCQCVDYHRNKDAIPGCFFTAEGEKLHDRSLATFFRDQQMVEK